MKTLSALLLALSFVAVSCGHEASNAPAKDSGGPAVSTEPTLQEKQRKALFVVDTYEDSIGIPYSKISVDYNDSRTFLMEIAGIAEIQNGNALDPDEIPKDALSTCGCWYAGGGDYFYLTPTGTGIAVYHGWLDEGVNDPGYHWEEMKKID
jgi:hypothetical protein